MTEARLLVHAGNKPKSVDFIGNGRAVRVRRQGHEGSPLVWSNYIAWNAPALGREIGAGVLLVPHTNQQFARRPRTRINRILRAAPQAVRLIRSVNQVFRR